MDDCLDPSRPPFHPQRVIGQSHPRPAEWEPQKEEICFKYGLHVQNFMFQLQYKRWFSGTLT